MRMAARGPDPSHVGRTCSRKNPVNQRPQVVGGNGGPRQSQPASLLLFPSQKDRPGTKADHCRGGRTEAAAEKTSPVLGERRKISIERFPCYKDENISDNQSKKKKKKNSQQAIRTGEISP